jgi:predicted phage baseplate assembly protein
MWTLIDDLGSAGPEVPVDDLPGLPGQSRGTLLPSRVFSVDPESGVIRFGDGVRGARPELGATIRATYDFGAGREGNVAQGAITTGAPSGVKVVNPIRTWGGAEAETVAEGEKQVSMFLQHRDRLVTKDDFETIVLRTPGVEIGRVEVIPAYNPALTGSEPGDAAGAVTLMLIPRNDPEQPEAPRPDRLFLDAICRYIDPRRLVTTEVFLRGPLWQDVWITIGIKAAPDSNAGVVREAVQQAVRKFLAPFTDSASVLPPDPAPLLATRTNPPAKGWPLRKPLSRLEVATVVARVQGVEIVRGIIVAKGTSGAQETIEFRGLELPHARSISVVIGDPLDLEQVRGETSLTLPGATTTRVPVPFIPEECR